MCVYGCLQVCSGATQRHTQADLHRASVTSVTDLKRQLAFHGDCEKRPIYMKKDVYMDIKRLIHMSRDHAYDHVSHRFETAVSLSRCLWKTTYTFEKRRIYI